MRILVSENQFSNLKLVSILLKNFVRTASSIYGLSFLCYNVHSLIHLTEDYEVFGSLEKISAFKFESYLGCQVKGAVRAGFKPSNQVEDHIQSLNFKTLPC